MKKLLIPFFSSLLVLLLLVSPTLTFAKNNKNGKENNNGNQVMVRQQSKVEVGRSNDNDTDNQETAIAAPNIGTCFKAWGHLIAPGWIKWNGTVQVPAGCWVPPGIAKKLTGGNATTTPPVPPTPPADITAPVIANLSVQPGTTSALVNWNTDELSNSTVFYSTSTPVSTSTAASVTRSLMARTHVVSIPNLTASTTYHALVTSRDAAGNVAVSNEVVFTTKATPIVIDTTAPIMTNFVFSVGSTTVQASWKTNEPATTKAYYATSTPVSTTTASVKEDTTLVTNHSITVTGLSTSTPYHLIFESKDAAGNVQQTGEFSIITALGL